MENTNLGGYFKTAIFGVVLCLASSSIDIYMLAKESDSLSLICDWLLILGAVVMGIGLIGAGNIVSKEGHTQTGVISAGGAMIFWALALIAYQFFADEDNMDFTDVSFYVWFGITLIGPFIFYMSLKQNENEEDKFLGWASWGMGAVLLSEVLFLGVILLLIWSSDGGGITHKKMGNYTYVTQSGYSALAEWIAENFKLVSIIISSIASLGYLIIIGCFSGYKDFVYQLKEVEREEQKAKLIDELLDNYYQEEEG